MSSGTSGKATMGSSVSRFAEIAMRIFASPLPRLASQSDRRPPRRAPMVAVMASVSPK